MLLQGKSADEIAQLKESNPTAFDRHFLRCCFSTYMLKGRIKNEDYNGEQRIKVSCTALQPIDFVAEGRHLLHEIQQHMGVGAGAGAGTAGGGATVLYCSSYCCVPAIFVTLPAAPESTAKCRLGTAGMTRLSSCRRVRPGCQRIRAAGCLALAVLCCVISYDSPAFNEKGDVVGVAFSGLGGGAAENIGELITAAPTSYHGAARLHHSEASH